MSETNPIVTKSRKRTVLSVLGLWPRYIGGSEIYLRELSRQLDEYGWRSVVCFLKEPSEQVREYLSLPNIDIEVLENADTPDVAALKKFAKLIRNYRPEILHLHLVGFLGLYPWLARLISTKRVFFTDHGSRPDGYVSARAPAWKRLAVRLINHPVTKVISVSDYNRSCMTTMDLLPVDRFSRVYNAVDFSRITNGGESGTSFRNKYGILADRTVVLQVSWIIPEKGIGDLLEAARLVIDKNDKVHFVLVGEGDDRAKFMRQADEMGLGKHITWTGLVQDPFAEGVYDAADIVCQASRWQEAFGQVIAEAMACGKPVVATRVGGIPEVIQDGKSGFLVDKGDSRALADRILQIAVDRDLQSKMGQAGRSFAREKFELQDMVRKVINLYGIA
ncbi:N-acetyl-alpha-D-glucosaminyl L-malate synthase BshA [soil metagenome]